MIYILFKHESHFFCLLHVLLFFLKMQLKYIYSCVVNLTWNNTHFNFSSKSLNIWGLIFIKVQRRQAGTWNFLNIKFHSLRIMLLPVFSNMSHKLQFSEHGKLIPCNRIVSYGHNFTHFVELTHSSWSMWRHQIILTRQKTPNFYSVSRTSSKKKHQLVHLHKPQNRD